MGAGIWGGAAVDLCVGLCRLAESRKVGGDFRDVPKPVVGAAGVCRVVVALPGRGGPFAIGAGVGCDVVDFVYQLCRHWFILGCHQAGENFRLSHRPHGVE